jgi:uncharacterized protein (TIGR00725 family)
VKCISVVGSDGEIGRDVEEAAEYVGAKIAEAGCVLVCGGRGGVMEATCRGAKKKGGLTIGILPTLNKKEANKHVDIILTTSLGYARNTIVASASDAVIAVGGNIGTLSEIALALNYDKPVVVVEGLGGVGEKIPDEYKTEKTRHKIHKAGKEDAVEKALSLINP